TVCRGHGDATHHYHDLDMQVQCSDGIRPVPATLREPQTARGLRADTMVSIASPLPSEARLGQVLGVIEETAANPSYSVVMQRTDRRRPARGPRAIEAKLM
ncbi:hypothetical protein FB107DRAFT_224877, partial [Schizophyllum commune]